MINRLIFIIISLILGIIIGILSADYATNNDSDTNTILKQYWSTDSPLLVNTHSSYELAKKARGEKINLETNDSIILKTDTDSTGEKLNARCIYKITNLNLPASFYTIYCENRYALPPSYQGKNTNLPIELASLFLLTNENNQTEIIIAPASKPQSGNWLVSPTFGNYNLVLSLHNCYHIGPRLSKFNLPLIQKIKCL